MTAIAKDIELGEPFANMGAKLIQEVASKTQDNAGDGTSTASILAQSLCHHGLQNMESGSSPVELKAGFDQAIGAVVESLKDRAVPVETSETIKQVATIASNNDEEIGSLIAEAVDAVGRDGVITVEEAKSIETTLDVVEGMQFDRGYLSPYFVTDAQAMQCVLEDCYILVYEKKISTVKDIVPLLEAVVNAGKPMLIVSEEVDGEALATLVINRLRGTFQVSAVKAPGYGDRRKAMLEDIAILTGATAVFENLGMKLSLIHI